MLDAGYWILDAGCWILDAGCWILDKVVIASKNTFLMITR